MLQLCYTKAVQTCQRRVVMLKYVKSCILVTSNALLITLSVVGKPHIQNLGGFLRMYLKSGSYINPEIKVNPYP